MTFLQETQQHMKKAAGQGLPLRSRGQDSNLRPSGYEPDELPLLYPATH
jgi:hypothetical protein